MQAVKDIRKQSSIPLIYLVYYNCIFKYGIEKFIRDCSKSGIDGLIIPDLPLEERGEIMEFAYENDIYIIQMVSSYIGRKN